MRRGPRVIWHKDGTVTVKGLSYADFSGLVTAAALYSHEELLKQNLSEETKHYDGNRIRLAKLLCPTPVWVNPYRDIPVSRLRPHERASRIQDAKLDRHRRREVDRIMRELLK